MCMVSGGNSTVRRGQDRRDCVRAMLLRTIVDEPYATWDSDQVLKPFLVPPMIGTYDVQAEHAWPM